MDKGRLAYCLILFLQIGCGKKEEKEVSHCLTFLDIVRDNQGFIGDSALFITRTDEYRSLIIEDRDYFIKRFYSKLNLTASELDFLWKDYGTFNLDCMPCTSILNPYLYEQLKYYSGPSLKLYEVSKLYFLNESKSKILMEISERSAHLAVFEKKEGRWEILHWYTYAIE